VQAGKREPRRGVPSPREESGDDHRTAGIDPPWEEVMPRPGRLIREYTKKTKGTVTTKLGADSGKRQGQELEGRW